MDQDLEARVALLEQHVDWLYAQAGRQGPYGTQYAEPAVPDWPYPVSPGVLELLRSGHKIAAIKQQRAETSQGLAQAKDTVEAAEAMLR